GDAGGGVAAALEVGGLDGFGAEEALDAGEGPGGSLGEGGLAAPKAGGAAGGTGQPPLELPAAPFGHDGGHAGRRVDRAPGTRPTAGMGRGAGNRVRQGRGAGQGGGGVVAADPA